MYAMLTPIPWKYRVVNIVAQMALLGFNVRRLEDVAATEHAVLT
jgi:hypothetical protein